PDAGVLNHGALELRVTHSRAFRVSWSVRCDREPHSAGRTEIDGMKVAAIKRWRDIDTMIHKRLRHPHKSVDIGDSPRDVIRHAGTRVARSMIWGAEKVN